MPNEQDVRPGFVRFSVDECPHGVKSFSVNDASTGVRLLGPKCCGRTREPAEGEVTMNPLDQLRDEKTTTERTIRAAANLDWEQLRLNAPACFHVEADGRFCLRALTWAGHQGSTSQHLYEPLYVALTRLAHRSPSHDLVEAADAMRAWARSFPCPDEVTAEKLRADLRAYDKIRSRHAEGAQPSGAPAPASAHAITTQPNAPTMTPRETPVVYDTSASAQGEVCEEREPTDAELVREARGGVEALSMERASLAVRDIPAGGEGPQAARDAHTRIDLQGGSIEALHKRLSMLESDNKYAHEFIRGEVRTVEKRLDDYGQEREEYASIVEMLAKRVQSMDERMSTPPSSEKTGEGRSASGSTGARSSVACDPSLPTPAPSPASPASEVKACPFCGGRASVRGPNDAVTCGIVGAHRSCCGAQVSTSIAAWNRRAPAPSPAHLPSCGWVQFPDGRVAETGECMCFGARIPSLEACMQHARETVERLGPNPNAHEVAREAAKATREFLASKPFPSSTDARLADIARCLAMYLRTIKAYPRSREKWIDDALDYCNRVGLGGSVLREEEAPAPSPAPQDQCPSCGGGVHAKGCGVLPSYSPERGWTDG